MSGCLRHRLCAAVPAVAAACLLAGASALAQPQNDARQLAGAIDRHYNALHSVEVGFTQSYDGMGMHRVERGVLLLTKAGRFHEAGGRMRWSYTEPAGKLFVFDGRDAYFYTPGQSEIERVPAKQLLASGEDLRSPLALLLGHAQLARQLDGLTLTPAANGDATLAGVPHGLEKRVSRLAVTASQDGTIHELVIEEPDGSRNRFQFTGELPNAPAPAEDFVFKAPLGTHVVDGLPPI